MQLKVIVFIIFIVSKNAYGAECIWACWRKKVRQEPQPELRLLPLEASNNDQRLLSEIYSLLGPLKEAARSAIKYESQVKGYYNNESDEDHAADLATITMGEYQAHVSCVECFVKQLQDEENYKKFIKSFCPSVVILSDDDLFHDNHWQSCNVFPDPVKQIINDYIRLYVRGTCNRIRARDKRFIDSIEIIGSNRTKHILADKSSRRIQEDIRSFRILEQKQLQEIVLLHEYNAKKDSVGTVNRAAEHQALSILATKHAISKEMIAQTLKRRLIMVPAEG